MENEGTESKTLGDSKSRIVKNASQYVKLNVGGYLFYTTLGTLCKRDTMLRAMFSQRLKVLTDPEGWIIIDRCGKHFGTILNFLRDDRIVLPGTASEIDELLTESKYYCIDELTRACEKSMLNGQSDSICRVVLINSPEEEKHLIDTATQPVVTLAIKPHGVCNVHEANILLKHITLFEKLSLRFTGRILFAKNLGVPPLTCCWSFYADGAKVDEVCCIPFEIPNNSNIDSSRGFQNSEIKILEGVMRILLQQPNNAPKHLRSFLSVFSAKGLFYLSLGLGAWFLCKNFRLIN